MRVAGAGDCFNGYRISRRYQCLRDIEKRIIKFKLAQQAAAIDNLEKWQAGVIERIKVPTTMLNDLYDLPEHTNFVLARLYAKRITLK